MEDEKGRTRFSLMAGLWAPSMSFWAADVNSAKPAMGRYSWLRLGSFCKIASVFAPHQLMGMVVIRLILPS